MCRFRDVPLYPGEIHSTKFRPVCLRPSACSFWMQFSLAHGNFGHKQSENEDEASDEAPAKSITIVVDSTL